MNYCPLAQHKICFLVARSNENPEKIATFTLHNGSVSVQLGNALLEQLDNAVESQPEEGINVTSWAKPIAVGSTQRMVQPLPVNDFDADLDGNKLQTTAWVRAGGLRLAPITITWDDVDNPQAAQAFIKELGKRKNTAVTPNNLPAIFDYWASWFAAGVLGLVFMVVMMRFLKRAMADGAAEANSEAA